jgi:colanic acid/amylovoran biosynthesis protein
MKVYLFACIEKNIGDDLFIKLLCERYPNIDFIISEQAEYGSLEKISNLHFSKNMSKWIWAMSLNPKNPIKKAAAMLFRAFYSLKLPKCDVAVSIVGNAFKNMDYTGWEQSRWIRKRIKHAKRFYLISTNFGPYKDDGWKEDFEKIYPKMADVCFRDEYSYELFKHLPNTRFAPDAVISMGKRSREECAEKRVIISLIDCSFAARSEELHRATDAFENVMAATAKKFLGEGYKVTFINSNTEQDRPACDRILRMIESTDVDVLDYDGNLEEVFELYQKSSAVIATRLHTIVLAWLYGLPVVPVVYDIKVENLLDSYKFTCDRYDIKKMNDISEEDIYNSICKYDFALPDKIVEDSKLQFREIDKEFLKKDSDR